jgi:glycine dehydrogenase
MVMSLTSMDIANASLLDEATGAAEGMVMAFIASNQKKPTFFVDEHVLPQTISVLRTRAKGFDINLVVGDVLTDLCEEAARKDICGVLVQYPDINGTINDYTSVVESVHASGGLVVCATDLLALTMLKPPGEWGADIVVGNSARFGVSLGYGGPHAGFFACTEKLKRKMPGRLIGRSKDVTGKPAYRLALQSKPLSLDKLEARSNPTLAREQHIRREKATSNICTSQALLANMAAMYAVYHGPEGLTRIARRVHAYTQLLNTTVQKYGFKPLNKEFFDTLTFDVSNIPGGAHAVHAAAAANGVNLREIDDYHVGVALDETVGPKDIVRLVNVFVAAGSNPHDPITMSDLEPTETLSLPSTLRRESKFLHHPVFNTHHSETEMLRYIYHLQSKDLGLVHAMIPLGSCTMKLNSTTSMMPVTWPDFSAIHPFAPADQVKGYSEIIKVAICTFRLEKSLTYRETGAGGRSLQDHRF